MPASISGVTLNDSFFYVNQLGDYNTFTANGHSTVAVVGTYLSHFYTSIPSYHFTQYSGTEYTLPYEGGKYGQDNYFTVKIKNASYFDTSEEILRGNTGKIKTSYINGDVKYMPLAVTAESYNSVFRVASGQRIMQMAVAHSPIFYDNAWLKVENGGEVADAVLNQNATAIINPGAKMSGTSLLNEQSKIMFGVRKVSPVQVDDLQMNTPDNVAIALEYINDGGLVDINNLTMRNSSFKFQRTADAREYATLNIKNLSGNGRFVINTDLSKGKGDFISVGHGTGNYHLVVADTGKEISGTAENLNLVLNKQGDAVFSLSNASGVNVPSIDGGTYTYTLQHKKSRDGEYWYLYTRGLC